MKITIGGLSGTGTSSVGRVLAKELNLEFVSGGNFARKLASARGMTIEEWDKYMLETGDFSDDEKIDGMQKEFGTTKDNFVLESRLGWFNVPDSLKIKLYCENDVRFLRTSKQDPERFGTTIDDFENTKKKSLEREADHRQRIKNLYGIENLNDDKHFDVVIDTTNLKFEEVLQKCLDFIESKKMRNSKIRIGIIGKGQFTNFIVPHLEKFFEVVVFGREEKDEEILKSLDYLVFSVPLQNLEEVCKEISEKISEKTILIDVTSVKVEPLRILKQYFLNNQILGTHPIFGPQSGKNGIEGLPIVLCNVSLEEGEYKKIKSFFNEELKLKVLEKTPGAHDREMAYVHGLSHFIGRALSIMEIQEYESSTKGYKNMIQLKETVGSDSWELYKTIQNGNPLAKEVRQEFLKVLKELEEKLESGI